MSKALMIVKQTLVSTRHSSCKHLPAVIKKQVAAIVPAVARHDQPLPDPLALAALAEYEEREDEIVLNFHKDLAAHNKRTATQFKLVDPL